MNEWNAHVALPLRTAAGDRFVSDLRAEGQHATFHAHGGELMAIIVPLDRDRVRVGQGRQPRSARSTVTIEELAGVLRLRVHGARKPTRIYLYVDGDLIDTWVDIEASYDASSERLPSGRHAVTVRAADALGRWAGASTIVER